RVSSNLSVPPTALIGREQECAALGHLLRQPDARLVTLTGPGGIGKTRLGFQVAAELIDDFPNGVYFVNLAPLRGVSVTFLLPHWNALNSLMPRISAL